MIAASRPTRTSAPAAGPPPPRSAPGSAVVRAHAGLAEPGADDVAVRVRRPPLGELPGLGDDRPAAALARCSIRAARIALCAPRPRNAGSVAPKPSQPTSPCDEERTGAGRLVAVVRDVARPARAADDVRGSAAPSTPASRSRRRRPERSRRPAPARPPRPGGRSGPRAGRRRARTSSSRSRVRSPAPRARARDRGSPRSTTASRRRTRRSRRAARPRTGSGPG